MEKYTKSHDPLWNRIVYIAVLGSKGVAKEINDKNTYKILVVDEGTLTMESKGIKQSISAPAMILLDEEEVLFTPGKGLSTTTVFFRPTEIRDEFTLESIDTEEFEELQGKTIYQDYLLIKPFKGWGINNSRILPLGLSAYDKISKTIGLMNNELTYQEDGYWPCRSRSYIMELLYFISYVCDISRVPVTENEGEEVRTNRGARFLHCAVNDTVSDNTVSQIIQYLSEHMADKVTLAAIEKEFSLNRNRLNELFVKETSMTCMNYLLKMRMNLAQIMLSETELRISEIADRVGYGDPNYFIKVFKSHTGKTPSKYRELYMVRQNNA